MEDMVYNVPASGNQPEIIDDKRKYLRRQLFVMSSLWLQGINCGINLAYPSVLIEKSSVDINITDDQATWLGASVGLSGILGFIILPLIFQIYGRKASHIAVLILYLISWVIFLRAKSIIWLFIGRFGHGLTFGIIYINGVIMSEYSNPESRGYYITIMKVFMTLGSLICRCLSFWTWREPAIAGVVLAVVALILNFFWPESPAFHAQKGNFEQCQKVFNWLNGSSPERRKELLQIVSAQMERQKHKTKPKSFWGVLCETCKDKSFLKALLIASLITLFVDASGRFFVLAYVIQIMTELVGKSTAVYYSIAVDCSVLIAFGLACLILKYLKRRTILFVFGTITSSLMILIYLVLLLKSRSYFVDVVWLTPCVIIVQNFLVNLTVISLCYTLLGEIFPLERRGAGTCAAGMVFSLFYLINLKFAPVMSRDLGLGATYGLFGLCMFGSLCILYFVLPETKSKTLQEIEDEMNHVTRDVSDATVSLNDVHY